jgi:acyl carrier protein
MTEAAAQSIGTQAVTDGVARAITAVGIDPEDISPERHLRSEFELDSTDLVEISLEIKRALGVEIELDLDDDPTVADVCDLVTEAAANA